MENKKRSLRLVILLAIFGFTGLVWVTSRHNHLGDINSNIQITYALDLEMKWVATDENMDFAVVQDTLSYYASAFGAGEVALSSNFSLNHCCEDAALRQILTSNSDFYHVSFSADFSQPETRQQLLLSLVNRGYLHPAEMRFAYGMGKGIADLTLPIPSQPGKVLHIRGSEFQLNLVPRVLDFTEDDPLA